MILSKVLVIHTLWLSNMLYWYNYCSLVSLPRTLRILKTGCLWLMKPWRYIWQPLYQSLLISLYEFISSFLQVIFGFNMFLFYRNIINKILFPIFYMKVKIISLLYSNVSFCILNFLSTYITLMYEYMYLPIPGVKLAM